MEDKKRRVLRVGVLREGRVVEETFIRHKRPITVGTALKNSIVVDSDDLPGSTRVMQRTATGLRLRSGGPWNGDIRDGHVSAVVSSDTRADVIVSDRAMGRLRFGGTTILFQFVADPRRHGTPALPMNMQGGLSSWSRMLGASPTAVGAILLSVAAQVAAVAYLVWMVPPPERTAEISTSFASLMTFAEPVQALPVAEPEQVDETMSEPAAQNDVAEGPPTAAAPEVVRQRQEQHEVPRDVSDTVTSMSALAVFTRGDSGESFLGFTSATTDRRAEEVIARQVALIGDANAVVSREGLATTNATGPRREGFGRVSSSVAEGAETERTNRDQAIVAPSVQPRRPQTAGQGTLEDLPSELRRRTRDIERCYMRALADQPRLEGRLVLQFTIGTDGRVANPTLPTNTAGDVVGRCAVRSARHWRFGQPVGGSVSVRVPYLLEVGN